ncbi:MAG: hypothetical protein ACYTFD_18910 [Planctomycetota bacterium]|jgi:hypothetical protein
MSEQVQDAVQQWLDEAATAMGGEPAHRRDALLELEATILDRLDERARSGQVPDEAVQDVLEMMGDPAEIGSSFMPSRPLIAPHQTRPFLLHTTVVFAVHFLLVIGATVADHELSLGPLRILPMANAKSVLELLARAMRTLLFDGGLVLCVYALLPRLGRIVRFPRASLAVRPDARRCLLGAAFLALVLVVVNFFRDNLLALYLPDGDGVLQIPFVGPGIVDNLLLLNLWLAASIVRELLYARRGERTLSLAVDVAANVLGLFCLLRIVATKRLVDLSQAQEALGTAADGIGAVLNSVFVLIALVTAALLAARTMRRAFRLAFLWK